MIFQLDKNAFNAKMKKSGAKTSRPTQKIRNEEQALQKIGAGEQALQKTGTEERTSQKIKTEERIYMRLRNIPGAREEIAACPYVVQDEEMKRIRGCWAARFGNDHPIRIEIGMGKVRFLSQLAMENPDINYVGIEMYSSVLLRALQKRQDLEESGIHLDNLLFLRMDAKDITDLFAPAEVDRIYLNFSDPWPKDRHAKRRLPGRAFLACYARILAPGGTFEFKTDNRTLFDFAVGEARTAGWIIKSCTYDLHRDPVLKQGNVMTEYEEKFSSMGNPICKYIIRPLH